jgi:TrpR-related protein YerC/YecD
MNKKIKTPEVEQLFKGILCLKSVEECYDFFEDICTIPEIKSISQRLEVAYLLGKKETYQKIADETGASSATISRVNRALCYGADGYRRVLDAMMENETDPEKENRE